MCARKFIRLYAGKIQWSVEFLSRPYKFDHILQAATNVERKRGSVAVSYTLFTLLENNNGFSLSFEYYYTKYGNISVASRSRVYCGFVIVDIPKFRRQPPRSETYRVTGQFFTTRYRDDTLFVCQKNAYSLDWLSSQTAVEKEKKKTRHVLNSFYSL